MIKIIKDLGDNKYEVEIDNSKFPKEPCARESGFGLAHDYFYVEAYQYLNNKDNSVSDVYDYTRLQIPIRGFQKVILPKILAHEYSKPEHLADREYYEDDKYNEPRRWKKGDLYAAYSESNEVIYFWEDKIQKVAILLQGEKEPTIMTYELFQKFISGNIKYKPRGNKI